MTIPDPAVYSALPVVAGALLWAAKAFVSDVINRTRRRTTTTTTVTTAPPLPPASTHVEMTLGDFRQIADLLKAELNGRYMFAAEAREKFSELGDKLDEKVEALEHLMETKVAELKTCILSGRS